MIGHTYRGFYINMRNDLYCIWRKTTSFDELELWGTAKTYSEAIDIIDLYREEQSS